MRAPRARAAALMSNFYGYSWDTYVKELFAKSKSEHHVYPGDEWGGHEWWNHVYDRLFTAAGAAQWERVVEIGAGSGKYTHLLLDRSAASVLTVDVSQEFLSVLAEREREHCATGRVRPYLLPCRHPGEL